MFLVLDGAIVTNLQLRGCSASILTAFGAFLPRFPFFRIGSRVQVGILSISANFGVRIFNNDAANAANRASELPNFCSVATPGRVLAIVTVGNFRPIHVASCCRVSMYVVEFQRPCRPIGDDAGHVVDADLSVYP